ncbi:hypothetical protein H7Y21_02900 [Arenimonas sp.]|nr:hypothetical protein [Candidatus Parcubacteria bacterium]
MSKNKIEGDINFNLRSLKLGEDYTVEAKIGGGQKEAHVTFANAKHLEEHGPGLEKLAKQNEFTVVLKAA